MKKCTLCEVEKAEDAFYVKDRRTGRLASRCKDCNREESRGYYRANKEVVKKRVWEYQKANPDVNARSRARRKANGKRRLSDVRKYGLSGEQYEALLERAGGICEICGRIPSEVSSKGACVDHCHDSNKVRGILCHPCNAALGNFRDEPDVLRAAIAYLERSVVH